MAEYIYQFDTATPETPTNWQTIERAVDGLNQLYGDLWRPTGSTVDTLDNHLTFSFNPGSWSGDGTGAILKVELGVNGHYYPVAMTSDILNVWDGTTTIDLDLNLWPDDVTKWYDISQWLRDEFAAGGSVIPWSAIRQTEFLAGKNVVNTSGQTVALGIDVAFLRVTTQDPDDPGPIKYPGEAYPVDIIGERGSADRYGEGITDPLIMTRDQAISRAKRYLDDPDQGGYYIYKLAKFRSPYLLGKAEFLRVGNTVQVETPQTGTFQGILVSHEIICRRDETLSEIEVLAKEEP